MTRLFLRFYLGVLAILFAAWCVQASVFSWSAQTENIEIAEQLFLGSARMTRNRIEQKPRDERDALLIELESELRLPVQLVDAETVAAEKSQLRRLAEGAEVVCIVEDDCINFVTPSGERGTFIQFGPLRNLAAPERGQVLTGLGIVLSLAATAIALLIRPVVRQLRCVELAADAIAEGNLSARANETRAGSARRLAKSFNVMAERTETLVNSQRELLQAVSHELRTPLSRIHFAIDLIKSARTDKERGDRLESMELAADDLDALVAELLHYVKLESDQWQPTAEEFDVDCVLNGLIQRYAEEFAAIDFELSSSPPCSERLVCGDRAGFERAAGNLLSNAGRFARTSVRVGVVSSADGLCVTVDDDGPGIPAAWRARVFEPFVRLDDDGHGAGLGLALVRRIASRNGGTASASEGPLGGCRIEVIWPTRPPAFDAVSQT